MNSFIQSIQKIIERDLIVLEKELTFYSSEDLIWAVRGDIKNSAGNLSLHLCGNLQHYIGAVLGNSGYTRNRDNEFAAHGMPRIELLNEIGKTKNSVALALGSLQQNVLSMPFPEEVFKVPMTTEYFLIHLIAHLGYHLGQINYHRRMIQNPSI
ncbi:MAG: DUF1572 domain-containing protein [Flammeovirgaceae bacterium]|jgi:uncharacterized damage-inducible protein DinB|nr:DUF1572 domain-containing protein [Flammeovirgaceae bacterium]